MARIKARGETLNETAFDILKSFFPVPADYATLKEIQKKTGLSYEPVYRVLNELVNKKIVSIKKVGRTLVYSLNTENRFAKIAYNFYIHDKAEIFSQKHKSIYYGLSGLKQDTFDILIIFGSYARGTELKDSDIDLLCVSSNQNRSETEIAKLARERGLKIHKIIVTKEEFTKIKDENKELWHSLITEGIAVIGYELFYYYAYLQ